MTSQHPSHGRALEFGRSFFGPDWHPTIEARANGRIEIIGNHIDYNGGPVLAAAIDRGITVLAASTGSGTIRASFPDLPDDAPPPLVVEQLHGWRATQPGGPADYLRGVVAAALEAGLDVRSSLDLVVHGDIPIGAAVSSSAALCVDLALVLVETDLAKPDLVRLAQDAEHRVGAPVGTMDQSASVYGGVILFGGSPDNVSNVSIELARRRFVVLGSGIEHSLSRSAYGDRVEESRRALALLGAHAERAIRALAEVDIDELQAAELAGVFVEEPVLHLRARHVVSETQRVRSAITALEAGDWEAFGTLMTASGRSSATDYDISHPKVEQLVAEALGVPGVLGARMMGGGEGGNALALVEESSITGLEDALGRGYYRENDLDAAELIFVCRIGEAASVTQVSDG